MRTVSLSMSLRWKQDFLLSNASRHTGIGIPALPSTCWSFYTHRTDKELVTLLWVNLYCYFITHQLQGMSDNNDLGWEGEISFILKYCLIGTEVPHDIAQANTFVSINAYPWADGWNCTVGFLLVICCHWAFWVGSKTSSRQWEFFQLTSIAVG